MWWRHRRAVGLVVLVSALLLPAVVAQADDVAANEHFQRVWDRTDRPVAEGGAARTWLWGSVVSGQKTERYDDAPDDERVVQYFDKSRMEITNPTGDPESDWYVTNGLLAVELITGRMQVADHEFEQRLPSELNVAGDQGFANGPSYATFGNLIRFNVQTNAPRHCDDMVVCERIDRSGIVTFDEQLADEAIEIGYLDEVTSHFIAAPFWTFMNSTGTVYEAENYIEDLLFENAFYATGRPITEPYWAHVTVASTERLVLIQCFERRCLTYTPDNPASWQVEAGNIGRHYHDWRYAEVPEVDGQLLIYRGAYNDAGDFINDIYTVNADGSDLTNLTPEIDTNVGDAVWSPDGSRLVFATDGDLFVMDGDGNNQQQLTSGPDIDAAPDWSPDGLRIAFQRGIAGQLNMTHIVLIDADGTDEWQLTNIEPEPDMSHAESPDWSPDGERITFSIQTRPAPLTQVSGIGIINVDGTGLRDIAPRDDAYYREPDWSPDGETIMFVRPQLHGREAWGGAVYTADADAETPEVVVAAGGDYTHPGTPSWSPDSQNITMMRTPMLDTGGGPGPSGVPGVVELNISTREQRQITHVGWSPTWSSDAAYLAFSFGGIAITDSTGLIQWVVVADGSDPQWRPNSGDAGGAAS